MYGTRNRWDVVKEGGDGNGSTNVCLSFWDMASFTNAHGHRHLPLASQLQCPRRRYVWSLSQQHLILILPRLQNPSRGGLIDL